MSTEALHGGNTAEHRRVSPCCEAEARRFLDAERARPAPPEGLHVLTFAAASSAASKPLLWCACGAWQWQGEGPVDISHFLAASPAALDVGSELGRLLAERDRLIAAGVDPDELLLPEQP